MSIRTKSFFIYLVFYLILFFQFPLKGALPGNCDSILAIALSNNYFNKLFYGLGLSSLYPATSVHAFGDLAPLLATLFNIFKVITFDDIYAYYFFIVIIFTLNAYAFFKLTLQLTKKADVSLAMGLMFSISTPFFAHIDDPNIIFLFFPLMFLYNIFCFQQTQSPRYLTLSMLCLGLQIYFGFYIFLFSLFFFVLFYQKMRLKDYLILGVLVLPMLWAYLFNHFNREVWFPWDNLEIMKGSALSLKNFFMAMPANLIYPAQKLSSSDTAYWIWIRKHSFIGFTLLSLALIGLTKYFNIRVFLLIITSLVLSSIFQFDFFLEVFSSVPLAKYFRVPSRFSLLILIGLCLFAGMGLKFLIEKYESKRVFLIVLFFSLHFLEHISFPLQSFSYKGLLRPDPLYTKYFSQNKKQSILLDLPSHAGVEWLSPSQKRIWDYNREMLYMNWQTYHKQIILNGTNGYLPFFRKSLDYYLKAPYSQKSLNYFKKLGVEFIIFHKKLVLSSQENIYNNLLNSEYLDLIEDNNNLAIFKLI
ncbi:MAG: hypothetical protein ACO20H_03770 [Bacteriovoracaceae bacterium]